MEFEGYDLKIKKPRGFFRRIYDPNQEQIQSINNTTLNALSTTNRIHMGNIPVFLKTEDIKTICT